MEIVVFLITTTNNTNRHPSSCCCSHVFTILLHPQGFTVYLATMYWCLNTLHVAPLVFRQYRDIRSACLGSCESALRLQAERRQMFITHCWAAERLWLSWGRNVQGSWHGSRAHPPSPLLPFVLQSRLACSNRPPASPRLPLLCPLQHTNRHRGSGVWLWLMNSGKKHSCWWGSFSTASNVPHHSLILEKANTTKANILKIE